MELLGNLFLIFAVIILLLVLLEITMTGAAEVYVRCQQIKHWWDTK